ncbi:MAG: T9SS type A sorting domain-containing protein, partial [Bacteroidota bacterium]
FYRIKMVGIDGSVSYSETESIVLEVNSVTLQTYPNPVRDILTVNLQSEGQQKVYLVLFDHLGRRIWYRYLDLQTGTQTIELDMTTYQTQLYYLSMIELGLSISDNSIKNVRVQKID